MRETIRSKLFLSWALSYLLVLLMPLLLGSFVYVKSVDTISEEITNVNDMALGQIKSVLDANFAELNRVVGGISLNQDVRTLMSLEKPLTPRNMLTAVNVQRDLARYLMTDTMIEEIYVYINNNDFIITSAYKYNSDMIPSVCEGSWGIGYDEFVSLSATKLLKELRLPHGGAGAGQQTSALYISSLFLNNYNKPTGTLIIKLNAARLKQLLHNMELTNQGDVLLVNARDEYYRTDALVALPAGLRYDAIRAMDGTFHEDIGGAGMTVAHVSSDVVALEYISLVPTEVFLQKVLAIRNTMLTYIAGCLLIGVVVSYLLARRNYSPLQKLKRMLGSKLNGAGMGAVSGDEYAFLENSLRTLLDEEGRAKDVLEKQANTQRNNFLARLLKGRTEKEEYLPALLRANKIAFGGELFIVASAHIEAINEDMLKGYRDNEDIYSLICSIVKSTGEELLGERYDAHVAEVDGMMAFIANAGDESAESFRDDCAKILEKVIAFLRDSFGITLAICLSGVKFGLQGLADAYSETLLAHEYRSFIGDKALLVRFDDVNKAQADSHYDVLGLSKQRMLANCMEARDYDGARRIVDELMSDGCQNVMSIQLLKIRVIGLVNIALGAVWDSFSQSGVDLGVDAEPVNRLLKAKSVAELREQVRTIFDALVMRLDDPDRKQAPDCIVAADEYVRAHYNEPDLSVAGIADKLGISMSYLSRTYKRCRGVGLLDCIHLTRVEHAKALLHGMNVGDVAEQVGYYDGKALIRAFRRYEGTTPAKMRDAGQ